MIPDLYRKTNSNDSKFLITNHGNQKEMEKYFHMLKIKTRILYSEEIFFRNKGGNYSQIKENCNNSVTSRCTLKKMAKGSQIKPW